MIQKLFEKLSSFNETEAIALGGSRAGITYDEKSDYDVYLYVTRPIKEKDRKNLLTEFCGKMEIGNSFWEYEDNCVLKNGIDIDILYRNLDGFEKDIESVVKNFSARNGYTTCMWHNLKTCKIIYDKNGRLTALQKRYDCAYPQQLKHNIIDRNMKLLRYGMPAFEGQILKAAKRGDINSVNHRTAEFMASYFDIIFALNNLTHPGEKRLVQLCERDCKLLPNNFAENIYNLFNSLLCPADILAEKLNTIIVELEKIIEINNY